MTTTQWLRDPTAETTALKRERTKPPKSLEGLTVALFDIGKTRSDEFLDRVEARFAERKLKVKRYAKPTNANVDGEKLTDDALLLMPDGARDRTIPAAEVGKLEGFFIISARDLDEAAEIASLRYAFLMSSSLALRSTPSIL